MTPDRRKIPRKQWLPPAGLILLSVVPVAAGMYRLSQLFGGAEVTTENARYFASPVPVVLHILTVSVFAILGAFQFVPGFRRRHPKWHRVAGRVLLVCGLTLVVTGLWMTLIYPPGPNDGGLLAFFRIVVSLVTLVSFGLGFQAVRRRDITAHRAWMIRGYALPMGAGTQLLTILPWVVLFGEPEMLPRAILMGAGWLINAGLAEWVIRRQNSGERITRAVPRSGRARSVAGVGPDRDH